MQQFNNKKSTSWKGEGNIPLFPDTISTSTKKKNIENDKSKVINYKIHMQKLTNSSLWKQYHEKRDSTHKNNKTQK